jgi:hypothetical protein
MVAGRAVLLRAASAGGSAGVSRAVSFNCDEVHGSTQIHNQGPASVPVGILILPYPNG